MTTMNGIARLPLLVALATMVPATGCGLICSDFEGNVRVQVAILEEDDNTYMGVVRVDPNEYEEYRDNRDRIENGEILGITVNFLDVPANNQATFAVGQIDVKRADAPDTDFITAVGEWNGVNVTRGTSFPVSLTPTAKGQVDDILFSDEGAIDLRIVGLADAAPIEFTAEVDVELGFSSCL